MAMYACGSGFVYHILSSYQKAIEQMDINYQSFGGLNEDLVIDDLNKKLTMRLFDGSMDLALREPNTELKQRVMSKKGTTEQGILAMSDIHKEFLGAGNAAFRRAQEIRSELMENYKKNEKIKM